MSAEASPQLPWDDPADLPVERGDTPESASGLATNPCPTCGVDRWRIVCQCPQHGLCTRHGKPLFLAHLGGAWLVCQHCLENTCDSCEEPLSLCTCRWRSHR